MSLQPARETAQVAPAGQVYTLTVNNSQFSTRSACNRCNGTFVLTGGTLTTGPLLACTLVACPEVAFDSSFQSLLLGNTTVALSGTTLELSSLRGVLRFRR